MAHRKFVGQGQWSWWIHHNDYRVVQGVGFRGMLSILKGALILIRDHPFKKSANFHDFWPLPPYHRHSSKMLMKGIFDPYVLRLFDHLYMVTPLPPKTCWRLKWMVPYFEIHEKKLDEIGFPFPWHQFQVFGLAWAFICFSLFLKMQWCTEAQLQHVGFKIRYSDLVQCVVELGSQRATAFNHIGPNTLLPSQKQMLPRIPLFCHALKNNGLV